MTDEVESADITGTMVAYYYICHRKLWLFTRGLNLENISGNVDVIKGKTLHEDRFSRESNRDIGFDRFKMDFIKFGNKIYVHEIKKSRKFEDAHQWQLKYYIYQLQLKGVDCDTGVIHYPASMRKLEVVLTEGDKEQIKAAIDQIHTITRLATPPKSLNKRVCQRCAYFDFCAV